MPARVSPAERLEEERAIEKQAEEEAIAVDELASTQKPSVQGLRNCSVDASDECKYYCPLCMMYYESVYETKCCGHTICDECVSSILEQAGRNSDVIRSDLVTSPADVPAAECEMSVPLTPRCTSSTVLPVQCPFCRKDDLELKVITGGSGDHLRNYDDSPGIANNEGETPSRAGNRTPNGSWLHPKPSPLKIGDSFEKMMAKMQPLQSTGAPGPASGSPAAPQPNPVERVNSLGRVPGRPPRPPRSSTPVTGVRADADVAHESTPGRPERPAVGEEAPAAQPDGGEAAVSDPSPQRQGDEQEGGGDEAAVIPGAVNVAPSNETTPRRDSNAAPPIGTPYQGLQPNTPLGVQPIEAAAPVQAVA